MTLSQRGFLVLSLLCAALVSAIFALGLPGEFLLDDSFNIVDNSGIRLRSLAPGAIMDAAFSMQSGGVSRTLPTLTFALDYLRGNGLDPATFKTTNIAIHALTTLVLAGFLQTLLRTTGANEVRARWGALALAIAWALHPLQVSSVLYVVQRMQTLATLFVVLAMWAYFRARLAQAEGRPGRMGLILTGLLWAISLGCKEDAVMLPAYLLALELTVLRFRAADPAVARAMSRGFLVMTLAGAALYLFLVLPYFWSWEAFPGRDFTSIERVLTQGRVLCLYLWQMLVPLPAHMSFHYDWIEPSRGLLTPWTTLPALLLLAALLTAALRLRHRRPLFALGILLFFAGHFVTSNVLGLELVFEHRNHFPLIGIVLAIGDLVAVISRRLKLRAAVTVPLCTLLLAALAIATAMRAHAWSDGLGLAKMHVRIAPESGRAWQTLCVAHFERGGGAEVSNPYLDKAIDACRRGADVTPRSVANLTNVIAFKGIQGSLSQADWDEYLARIEVATMTPENTTRIWVILDQVRNGVTMDITQVVAAIDAFHDRKPFPPIESAALGYFILGHSNQPDRAYRYFENAVRTTRDPRFATGIIRDLRHEGYQQMADRLQAVTQSSPPAR
ncbi:hypothetical protein [Luteimonas kalidii]|uniref:Tetratricopeptide repeat protein n=1 Tax=Luteimonas kalidii TaxID=3042025 RepID=A0ABT6JQT1_9GAMM|nr:hypothetical protein [Luteimonas kalidii]MDH5833044.1 hypothetical protein [Luteimonas kalidii]